jgi:transposase
MNFTKDFFNLLLDFGDEWAITNIESNHKSQEVFLDLEYVSDSYEDPLSLTKAKLYDHTEVRVWRHLDILHYKSYVRCRIPRVLCSDGKVRQISIGWADKHGRHTFSFEIKVIDLLKVTKNQTKTAEYLSCSFRLVNRIMHRCTQRGMERRSYSHIAFEHISIDEKSFQKGHKYVTVISHPKSGVILDVGEGRDTTSTEQLLDKTFTKNQLESINTVSMDMWKPYMQSIDNKVPNAEIVHDKFHLIKYLNEAIDKVRRREVQKNEVLKNSRYILLKNEQNLTAKQQVKYQMIKDSNFEVTKAMNIRENFKSLFDYCHEEGGAIEILKNWAQDSFLKCIKEMNKVITTFINHAWGIVNALISGLNNAMAERLNGKIQEIKLAARGYRTFQNFRSAILFFYGGLDIYPQKMQ